MAISRRLFLGGLLTVAAAPAIVTSKGFKPAVTEALLPGEWIRMPPSFVPIGDLNVYGTTTGRWSSSEPAWQELRRARPYQRDAIKAITLGQRYGTQAVFAMGRRTGKSMVALDYAENEVRALAHMVEQERKLRDMFNALR